MRLYSVTFERVGRGHLVGETRQIAAHDRDPDDIAATIHRLVRPMLASREYDVSVELDAETGNGRGSIGSGRSGRFTIEEVAG